MSTFIFVGKIIASLFIMALFITGLMKAHPRFHTSQYPPLAEYTTGFILTSLAVLGFYYLWW